MRSNETNLALTRSSQQIAQEARKDSSAMKSIAVLTMTFLPATYIAVSGLGHTSRNTLDNKLTFYFVSADSLCHPWDLRNRAFPGAVLGC